MSKYTYINILSEYVDTIEYQSKLGLNLRESERIQNCLFARIGGWKNNFDGILSENSWLVYDVPIHLSSEVEDGDKIATVLIDRFEDTGNSHRTHLYEVRAYDSVHKVTEKEIIDDRVGEKTESYYKENHDIAVRVHY